MADFVISVPSDKVTTIVNALASYFGYQSTIGDPPAPNPQTKADFVKGKIKDFLREAYKAGVANIAAETARQTAINDADTYTSGITVT